MKAYNEIFIVKDALVELRKNIESNHKVWYEEAKKLAAEIGVKPRKRRVCFVKKHWENYDAKECEDYYQQAVSIPFLEHVIEQFEQRFNSNSSIVVSSFVLVPKLLASQVKEKGPGSWNASICELVNHYAEYFPHKFKLKAEMDIYETFWLKEDERLTKESIPGNYYYSWNILNINPDIKLIE